MRSLIIIAIILFCPLLVWADVHTATTCSAPDVQAAITAASDFDTISVPSGTCHYSASMMVTLNNKAITLAGQADGSTVIIDDCPGASNWSYVPILVTSSTKTFRITNFTFVQGTVSTGGYGFIFLRNSSMTTPLKGWRIDNNWWGTADQPLDDTTGMSAVGLYYGLMDHNIMRRTQTKSGPVHWITIDGRSGNDAGFMGSYVWSQAPSWGTDDALYIEDNTLISPSTTTQMAMLYDSSKGGRTVVRYNTFNNSYIGTHGRDGASVAYDGAFTYEIYNNTFTSDKSTGNIYTMIGLRSGTGFIYNNSITGNYNSSIIMYNYCTNYNPVCTDPPWTGRYPDTTYPPSGIATNVGKGNRDLIGWTSDGAGGQTSRPLLIWGNTIGSGITAPYADTSIIQADRDYCYTTSGTMPTSCNGVNTSYAAYTYPHPLFGAPPATHVIEANSGANGTLVCANPVVDGQAGTCTATADAGYRIASISGCGGTWTPGSRTYTTPASSISCTVNATFHNSKMESFGTSQRITVSTGNRLTIP